MMHAEKFEVARGMRLAPSSKKQSICQYDLHNYMFASLLHCPLDHINVLLVGSGDLRHVLATVALAFNSSSKPIHVRCVTLFLRVHGMMYFMLTWYKPSGTALK